MKIKNYQKMSLIVVTLVAFLLSNSGIVYASGILQNSKMVTNETIPAGVSPDGSAAAYAAKDQVITTKEEIRAFLIEQARRKKEALTQVTYETKENDILQVEVNIDNKTRLVLSNDSLVISDDSSEEEEEEELGEDVTGPPKPLDSSSQGGRPQQSDDDPDGEEEMAVDIAPSVVEPVVIQEAVLDPVQVKKFIDLVKSEEVIEEVNKTLSKVGAESQELQDLEDKVKAIYGTLKKGITKSSASSEGFSSKGENIFAMEKKLNKRIKKAEEETSYAQDKKKQKEVDEYIKVREQAEPVIAQYMRQLRGMNEALNSLSKLFEMSGSQVYIRRTPEKTEIIIYLKKEEKIPCEKKKNTEETIPPFLAN